jgi:hypothetical protein
MPPFRRMNSSSGSASGLHRVAYLMAQDHLLRVLLSALVGSAVHRMDGRLPAARRPGRAPAISMLASLINADCVTQHYGQSFD